MQSTNVLYGESLLDHVVRSYGNIAVLFDIALLNGISIDAEPEAGIMLNAVDAVPPKEQVIIIVDVAAKKLSDTVKPIAYQTPVDIAMQEAGSTEGLFDFALMNGIAITDDLIAGNAYIKPDVLNSRIKTVFNDRLKPACGNIKQVFIKPGGIGFMQIENTFIVS